jgi:hypothetical protein
MRIDPTKVGYLGLASEGGAQIAEAGIRQTGERIASVATPFALIPFFRNYRIDSAVG